MVKLSFYYVWTPNDFLAWAKNQTLYKRNCFVKVRVLHHGCVDSWKQEMGNFFSSKSMVCQPIHWPDLLPTWTSRAASFLWSTSFRFLFQKNIQSWVQALNTGLWWERDREHFIQKNAFPYNITVKFTSQFHLPNVDLITCWINRSLQ